MRRNLGGNHYCLYILPLLSLRRPRTPSLAFACAFRPSLTPNTMAPHQHDRIANKYEYATTAIKWRERQHEEDEAIDSDDEDKRIRLPNLKYGYRTVPLEWEEIVYAVENDMALLSRSVTQQRDYEIYKRDLLREWSSVLDHVISTKFPETFQAVPDDAADGRLRAHPPLAEAAAAASSSNSFQTALVPNDFPYYMANGLEHWVLWKLGGPCSDEDVARAKQELVREHGLDANQIIHWVNPPNLQSLPAIDHVHIIGVAAKQETEGNGNKKSK